MREGRKITQIKYQLEGKKQAYYCQSSIATEQLCFSEDSYLYLVLEFLRFSVTNRNKGPVLPTQSENMHTAHSEYICPTLMSLCRPTEVFQ